KLEGRTRAARLPATAPPTGPATNVPAPVMALRPTDLPIFTAVAVPKDDSLWGGGGGPEGRGAAHCNGPTLGDCSLAPSALDPLWQAVRIAEKVTSRLILVRDESTCLSWVIPLCLHQESGKSLICRGACALLWRSDSPTYAATKIFPLAGTTEFSRAMARQFIYHMSGL